MGSAFFRGLMDPISKKLEERHQEEDAQKKERRSFYWKALSDPGTSAEGREVAQAELQKLLHPESKKGLAKVGEIFKRLAPPPNPQAAAGQQQQQQPAATQQDADGRPTLRRLEPPGLAQVYSNYGKEAEARKVKTVQDERDRRAKQERPKDVSDRDWLEFVETGRLAPGGGGSQSKTVAERWKLGDQEFDVDYDPVKRIRYDGKGEEWEPPEGAQRVAAKASTARPTIIASDFVVLPDAKKLAGNGVPFMDATGKPLDLAKIPDGMVLQKIHFPDGRTLYEPRNINDKVIKVNNQVVAVNPAQVQQVPQGAGTILGTANTGSTSTHEVVAEDAAGNPVAMPLNSTRTPITPPIRQSAPPGAPAPTPSGPPSQGPRIPPATSGAGAPAARLSAPGASAGGARPLPAFTPGQADKAKQRIVPVREAAVQLVGDPSIPDMKTIKDFSHLADNAGSQQRLGKAFRLMFDELRSESKGGHINADAGPISVAVGSPLQVIENAFGLPGTLADQRASIMRKAVAALTPEESEYFNSALAAYATVIGLRSLTKASAAQSSVESIEREIPLIGVHTTDSKSYRDKLRHILAEVSNGTKDKTTQAILEAQSPGLLKRIQDGAASHDTSLPKPSKKGDAAPDAVLAAYLKANGGNKEETRKALTAAGWTIGK